jgi:signal transduction histidine kinase
MWDTLTSGRSWSGHLINRRKDGTLFEEEATISPIQNAAGDITNFVAVKRDITERRKMELVLNQSERISAVGQLAAGVAHEINNPLTVVLGFAQSILARLTPDNPLHMPMASIVRETLRCKTLVQDLLTFSRQKKPGARPESPVSMVENALNLVEPQARFKRVSVRRDFDSHLPAIMVDRTQIQQVIINLCTNAIDAMPDGGTLTLQVRRQDACVEIRVTDTGTGIPADIQNRIFEPFFTTKEIGKGTGLGLGLVYEILKNHQGSIDFKTEVGKGTTFIARLPLAQKPPSTGSENPPNA